MNFTFHQLRVFLKIAELGSVTKAAAALHLTQPAVSSQLKLLQNQIDLPLTEIIGRKIHITEHGRELEVMAREILRKAEDLEERLSARDGRVAGKLRLAVVSTGKYFVPPILAQFNRKHPGASVILDVSNRREVEESLQGYEADFAIVSENLNRNEYEAISFLPNPLVLVGPISPVGFHLPDSGMNRANLKKMPYIFREEGSGTRIRMEEFLKSEGIDAEIRMELRTNEAVKQLILAGFGISLLSLYSLRLELKAKELKLLSHEKLPLKSSWKLVWLKGKRQSPTTEAFLSFVREESPDWIEKLFPWINSYLPQK